MNPKPPLNLFYREPAPDRWLPLDRFPRRIIRRLLRGPRRPGGQERVFLNLCAGLDEIGVAYRANDLRHARLHPDELCCVLGKRHVLDSFPLPNPLMVGPCCHSHSCDAPDLALRDTVRRILVPGEWMRRMCEPVWGARVEAWPVGIDTTHWAPEPATAKTTDFLIYNKIRWDHARRESELTAPIRAELQRRGLSFSEIRYGDYAPAEFKARLADCKAMIFLCEHETQGIAYQEALSSGVPLLAWDHGGEWLDPEYHPDRVRFGPVSAVPYWDERCGLKFTDATQFASILDRFLPELGNDAYRPREFIVNTLSLARCAQLFVAHVQSAQAAPSPR